QRSNTGRTLAALTFSSYSATSSSPRIETTRSMSAAGCRCGAHPAHAHVDLLGVLPRCADLNGEVFEAAIILPTPWWRSLFDAVAVHANWTVPERDGQGGAIRIV